MSNAPRQSKNERRDAAREKARQERVRQQKREKRNRAVLQLSIGVVIVAIVAVVAVIIVNSVRPPGPGPANMANGGITIEGSSLSAARTPAAAADATASPASTTGGPVRIQVFEDFACPVCKAFEDTNGQQIEELVKSGAAVVQYHPVAILDRLYPDKYSTRAANAAAAVANYSPDQYYDFHTRMYAIQPDEQTATAGPSDDQIIAVARQAGVRNLPQIRAAIEDDRWDDWVSARTDEFTENAGPLRNVDFPSSREGAGTPTVVVNGQYYPGAPNDASAFGAFVTSVGGSTSGSATPSATPSASASSAQ